MEKIDSFHLASVMFLFQILRLKRYFFTALISDFFLLLVDFFKTIFF